MTYKVIKFGFDGIAGGESHYNSIDEVLREVVYHKGWDSTEQLHASIRKWSEEARPGDVFSTQVTAIVVVGISAHYYDEDHCPECNHEGLDYEDLSPEEGAKVTQIFSCPECGGRWQDEFVLAERHRLF